MQKCYIYILLSAAMVIDEVCDEALEFYWLPVVFYCVFYENCAVLDMNLLTTLKRGINLLINKCLFPSVKTDPLSYLLHWSYLAKSC